jgi:hypothetical protein
MKHGVIFFFSATLLAILAAPLSAWAHANPDFDDDAKPILRMQPGLLQYVESRFDVKDTGTAKYPGDDDRSPSPPYIFRARPVGSSGPYNLRLLIQPGPEGHILGVVDITKVHVPQPATHLAPPAVAKEPPPQQYQPPQQTAPSISQGPVTQPSEPSAPAASQQPSGPTADTPSGPIMDSASSSTPSSNQSGLTPPPDPAPNAQ